MKKTVKYMLFAAAVLVGTTAFAGPPRHHREKGNDGLRLAAGIVNLVTEVIAPAPQPPVICYRPAPPPPPPRKVIRRTRVEHRRPAPPPRKPAKRH